VLYECISYNNNIDMDRDAARYADMNKNAIYGDMANLIKGVKRDNSTARESIFSAQAILESNPQMKDDVRFRALYEDLVKQAGPAVKAPPLGPIAPEVRGSGLGGGSGLAGLPNLQLSPINSPPSRDRSRSRTSSRRSSRTISEYQPSDDEGSEILDSDNEESKEGLATEPMSTEEFFPALGEFPSSNQSGAYPRNVIMPPAANYSDRIDRVRAKRQQHALKNTLDDTETFDFEKTTGMDEYEAKAGAGTGQLNPHAIIQQYPEEFDTVAIDDAKRRFLRQLIPLSHDDFFGVGTARIFIQRNTPMTGLNRLHDAIKGFVEAVFGRQTASRIIQADAEQTLGSLADYNTRYVADLKRRINESFDTYQFDSESMRELKDHEITLLNKSMTDYNAFGVAILLLEMRTPTFTNEDLTSLNRVFGREFRNLGISKSRVMTDQVDITSGNQNVMINLNETLTFQNFFDSPSMLHLNREPLQPADGSQPLPSPNVGNIRHGILVVEDEIYLRPAEATAFETISYEKHDQGGINVKLPIIARGDVVLTLFRMTVAADINRIDKHVAEIMNFILSRNTKVYYLVKRVDDMEDLGLELSLISQVPVLPQTYLTGNDPNQGIFYLVHIHLKTPTSTCTFMSMPVMCQAPLMETSDYSIRDAAGKVSAPPVTEVKFGIDANIAYLTMLSLLKFSLADASGLTTDKSIRSGTTVISALSQAYKRVNPQVEFSTLGYRSIINADYYSERGFRRLVGDIKIENDGKLKSIAFFKAHIKNLYKIVERTYPDINIWSQLASIRRSTEASLIYIFIESEDIELPFTPSDLMLLQVESSQSMETVLDALRGVTEEKSKTAIAKLKATKGNKEQPSISIGKNGFKLTPAGSWKRSDKKMTVKFEIEPPLSPMQLFVQDPIILEEVKKVISLLPNVGQKTVLNRLWSGARGKLAQLKDYYIAKSARELANKAPLFGLLYTIADLADYSRYDLIDRGPDNSVIIRAPPTSAMLNSIVENYLMPDVADKVKDDTLDRFKRHNTNLFKSMALGTKITDHFGPLDNPQTRNTIMYDKDKPKSSIGKGNSVPEYRQYAESVAMSEVSGMLLSYLQTKIAEVIKPSHPMYNVVKTAMDTNQTPATRSRAVSVLYNEIENYSDLNFLKRYLPMIKKLYAGNPDAGKAVDIVDIDGDKKKKVSAFKVQRDPIGKSVLKRSMYNALDPEVQKRRKIDN
jgi:hypothetical protein